MEQFHSKPENTVYIGDSIIDAKQRKARNCTDCGYNRTDTAEDLKTYPHLKICSCLTEAADTICG